MATLASGPTNEPEPINTPQTPAGPGSVSVASRANAEPAEQGNCEPHATARGRGFSVFSPGRLIQTAIGGMLMGVANLIPGVSGGTMILAMGLYEEFIDSVADVTALRFSARRIVFLGVLGTCAAGAVVVLSSVILYLLFAYSSLMFALFIGLTLGGTPTLLKMIGRVTGPVVIATVAGIAVMVLIALAGRGAEMPRNTGMDLVSGVVGSTTMVLPGISGSYMLLVLNQYDRVIGAVDDLRQQDWSALWVMGPVGIGGVIGIVGLSNLLKFLLHRYEKVTLGFLLGMLLGSVLGLWPFGRPPTEKILEKRSDQELLAYAEGLGIEGAKGLSKHELAEHILIAWHLETLPPELAARKHSVETLRSFAAREGVVTPAAAEASSLAEELTRQWSPGRPWHTPPMAWAMAGMALVMGFAATALLGRLQQDKRERARCD